MSRGIRTFHRWTSIVFVGIVLIIFGLLGAGIEPAQWVYFLPLPPLFLLMLTGLYMFALPYVRRRGAQE
jgi:ABC-type polysaccharide/polyol phosphate export permease